MAGENPVEKLIGKLVDLLIREQIIKAEEAEIYYYCFEAVFSRIYFYGTILLIAWFTGNVILTLFYYFGFLSIRLSAGGYHASTHMRCYVASILMYLFNLCFINILPEKYILLAILLIYAGAFPLIYILAPVDHVNRPFSDAEYAKLRIRSKVAVTLVCIFALVIFNFAPRFSWAISCGTTFAAGSFLLAWCKRRREKHNDQKVCI